ncbi:MAG: GNAT family N-acetyltransferase [Parachlamydiales bacterium]|jgi:3-dehydroquinate dehydratase/shikimate dehydrogenase
MPAPVLTTKRLILRHWRESDLIAFSKMNADPRVMEFFPKTLSKAESDEIAKKLIKELKEKDYGLWAVEAKNIAPFIGFIGLHSTDYDTSFTPCIEIAWRLAYEHWNKGYATEGAKEALDYGFNKLKLKEIVSFTAIKNLRSRKVMEKLGMVHNPKDDFNHPKLPLDHPLSLHVLYRLNNPNFKKFIK